MIHYKCLICECTLGAKGNSARRLDIDGGRWYTCEKCKEQNGEFVEGAARIKITKLYDRVIARRKEE